MNDGDIRAVRGWCALCRSRCGCVSIVREDRLIRVEPDPGHPTGRALCAKGRAAPELVHHPDRLTRPLRRTRPKGDPDPGWREIGWDEALDETAAALRRFAAESGPESVAFAVTTPSGTAISDAIQWIERLIRAYGSPNNCYGTEICNWHKDVAHAYTFGSGVGTPDLERAGCVILWGHNPNVSWLARAERLARARARGARVVVVDPRRVGPAVRADRWLRVRPGTDGALALALAGAMIEEGWYDEAFVRRWTNAPFLVHEAEDRLLTAADLDPAGRPDRFVVWDRQAGRAVVLDPAADVPAAERVLLDGEVSVPTPAGRVACRTVFARYAGLCRAWPPGRAEAVTSVPAAEIRETARTIWEGRPVACHAWSGVAQHTNATQTERAIALLYALTGSYDAPGGNVHFAPVPVNDVGGADLPEWRARAPALGQQARPLGPSRDGWVTADELYRGILDREPYAVRGLVAFGTNLLVSRADPARGARALAALEFHVHADLFLNPTAAYADIVLPVTSPWEHEALRVGFEVDQAATGLVQLRPAAVPPVGEARPDTGIVFDLAVRLGLGDRFWQGDVEAGLRHLLAPSGITPDALRRRPEGIRYELATRFRKYAEDGGFPTPSRRVEIWSETFRRHGQAPLPEFVEPAPADPDGRFPLILTSVKRAPYCHSQHRNLPALRRLAPEPSVEIHPDAAAARGIVDGDWVAIETAAASVRARARLTPALDPRVVAAEHGWWQGCAALGLGGYPATGAGSANLNALIGAGEADPISGSVPHRSYRCEVRRLDGPG